MRIVQHLLVASSFLGAVACGGTSNTPTVDSGPAIDVARTDAAAPADTGPANDVATPTDANVTVQFIGTCAAPVDLNTAGTTVGHVTTIHGSNAMAQMAESTGLPQPSCASGNGGYQSVFSYTMATTAALEVNTALASTPTTIDTIVYILQTCGATGMELACNDDVDPGNDVRSTAFSSGAIAAGTTVYIVLAGYVTPDTGNTSFGNVTLEVSELVPNAIGATCTASNPTCVANSTCIAASTMATSGTCVANGTNNGACNTTVPYCNTGLGCSTAMPTATNGGVCQVPIAAAGACDTTAQFVCVTGYGCVPADLFNGGPGTCNANGANHGPCNTTMPYCNTGFLCSTAMPTDSQGGVCGTSIADGMPCSNTDISCVAGDSCVPGTAADGGTATTGTCIMDGSRGGFCLSDGTCNTGLTCDPNSFTCS